jgi:MFE-2 hydratase 2 N-terminal domain
VHRPVPALGDVSVVTTVAGIYDKGSGALVVLDSVATDNTTRQRMFTASTAVFVVGHGSFGGARGPSQAAPQRRPSARPTRSRSPRRRRCGRSGIATWATTGTRCTPTRRRPDKHG